MFANLLLNKQHQVYSIQKRKQSIITKTSIKKKKTQTYTTYGTLVTFSENITNR